MVPVKQPDSRQLADPMVLADEAYQGLVRLLTTFSEENAAYMARPREAYALGYNDYEHLARFAEWASEVGE